MKRILALFFVLVTVFSVFAGCGKQESNEIVLPVQNVADTEENRIAAMLQTALAYYYKNPCIQYDCQRLTPVRRALGIRTAGDNSNTPEHAGPQRTCFQVCSYYTYQLAYQTFGYRTQNGWENFFISEVARNEAELTKPVTVWQHTNSSNPKDPQNLAAMEELRKILRPGDLINYNRYLAGETAHCVMWAGDLNGDGYGDILHVGGDYYDDVAMTEVREETGAVYFNSEKRNAVSGEHYFFLEPDQIDYFPKLKSVSVIRLTEEKHAAEYPLTEKAKTRLLYPGLEIYFEGEKGIYGAVAQGGEYTYTLRIENNADQHHKGLLIQLPVPQNGEIVKVDGKEVASKTVKRTVEIPAMGQFSLTYTVKATGAVGDVITTGVGYVHAIPLPSLNTVITSKDEDVAAVKAAIEGAKGTTGADFVNTYLAAMGYDLTIPAPLDTRDALYSKKNYGALKLYEAKPGEEVEQQALYKMQIPEFFGGQSVATDIDSLRVKELRNEDLLAGDILIWQKEGGEPMAAVHNGTALVMPFGNGLTEMEQWRLDEFIMYEFFIALRPTQAK